MTPTLIIRLPSRKRSVVPNVADHARRNSRDDCEAWNVVCHDRARANQRAFADRNASEDRSIAADAGSFLHDRFDHFPIGFGLRRAIGVHRLRINVVRKHHAVSDKTFIFDSHAFTDERMGRYFATLADARILLNLNKRTDLCFRTDLAAVKIDEVGLKDAHAVTDDYVCCYRHLGLNAFALEQTRKRVRSEEHTSELQSRLHLV